MIQNQLSLQARRRGLELLRQLSERAPASGEQFIQQESKRWVEPVRYTDFSGDPAHVREHMAEIIACFSTRKTVPHLYELSVSFGYTLGAMKGGGVSLPTIEALHSDIGRFGGHQAICAVREGLARYDEDWWIEDWWIAQNPAKLELFEETPVMGLFRSLSEADMWRSVHPQFLPDDAMYTVNTACTRLYGELIGLALDALKDEPDPQRSANGIHHLQSALRVLEVANAWKVQVMHVGFETPEGTGIRRTFSPGSMFQDGWEWVQGLANQTFHALLEGAQKTPTYEFLGPLFAGFSLLWPLGIDVSPETEDWMAQEYRKLTEPGIQAAQSVWRALAESKRPKLEAFQEGTKLAVMRYSQLVGVTEFAQARMCRRLVQDLAKRLGREMARLPLPDDLPELNFGQFFDRSTLRPLFPVDTSPQELKRRADQQLARIREEIGSTDRMTSEASVKKLLASIAQYRASNMTAEVTSWCRPIHENMSKVVRKLETHSP